MRFKELALKRIGATIIALTDIGYAQLIYWGLTRNLLPWDILVALFVIMAELEYMDWNKK